VASGTSKRSQCRLQGTSNSSSCERDSNLGRTARVDSLGLPCAAVEVNAGLLLLLLLLLTSTYASTSTSASTASCKGRPLSHSDCLVLRDVQPREVVSVLQHAAANGDDLLLRRDVGQRVDLRQTLDVTAQLAPSRERTPTWNRKKLTSSDGSKSTTALCVDHERLTFIDCHTQPEAVAGVRADDELHRRREHMAGREGRNGGSCLSCLRENFVQPKRDEKPSRQQPRLHYNARAPDS
jgi:hypothetical protein